MTHIALEQVDIQRGNRRVVHKLTLSVARGEWLSVIGPNGAGKTTLLHALAALLPISGEIAVNGTSLYAMSRTVRAQQIALVQQDADLPAGMRVVDYVMLGRTPYISHFGREGAVDRRVVSEVLDQLELWDFASRPLGHLSGGERQRVVVARALAQEPSILLLDEPTTALDLGRQLHVLDLVRRLQTNRTLTVVSATHDLTLAAAYADQLALLSGGHLAAHGTPNDVLTTAILEEHYGVSLRVIRDNDGGIAVIPHRSPTRGGPRADEMQEPVE